MLDAFEEVRRTLDIQLWAYVIMPEHVHLLIYPNRDEYEMRVILAALKRPVSRQARMHLEAAGHTAPINYQRVGPECHGRLVRPCRHWQASCQWHTSRAHRAVKFRKRYQTDWLARLTVRYPSRTVFRFRQPGGGFDRNIFKEKKVAQVIAYIHDNPVRRGLVHGPLDWEWSSARFWEGRSDDPIRMDEPFV